MALLGRDTELGYELPSIGSKMSLEKWIQREELQQRANPGFHSPKNIHTDLEAAQNEGLKAPVAGGPYVTSHISRMMLMCFGEGWLEGGRISIKLIRPTYPDDFITAKAIVKQKLLEDNKIRLVCDVWVEKSTGEKVCVGTASGLVS